MATFYKDYNTGTNPFSGTNLGLDGRPKSSIPDIINQISNQTRNNTRDLIQGWLSGNLSLEDWIQALQTGTRGAGPVMDPTQPPQINTGSGPVALTPDKLQQLAQGKSLQEVLTPQQTTTQPPTQQPPQGPTGTAPAGAPNLQGLKQGSQGEQVKQLQQFLVQNGYMTQAEMNTGPGIYGPKTQAAVTKYQQSQGTQPTGGPAQTTTSPSGTTTPTFDTSTLSSFFTPDQISQMPDSVKTMLSSVGDMLKKSFEVGGVNSFDINQAFQAAQNDPDLIAKYGESLKFAQNDLQFTLGQLQQATTEGEGLQNIQQEQERQNLALQEASAGRAFSGFRTQAEQNLAKQQQAVISSSKRDLQAKLQQFGTGLESKFGTAGLQQFGIPSLQYGGSTLAYSPIGGMGGTEALQKKADVLSREQQLLALNPK